MTRVLRILVCIVFITYPIGALFAQQGNINDLSKEIRDQRQRREDLEAQIKQLQSDLVTKQREKISLANQIAIIANQIKTTELEIKLREASIQEKALQIRELQKNIDDREKYITSTKKRLSAFLVLVHEQDQRGTMALVFASSSFSDFFDQARTIEELQQSIQRTLNDVQAAKKDLEKKKIEAVFEQKQIEDLRNKLQGERDHLDEQQSSKSYILDQTRQSERQFQTLLSAAKREQEAANADIQALERQLREKLQGKLPPGAGEKGLLWPVSASRGISAYFNDPSYPYRFIFEHPAIDIRTPQGSAIRAAAGGIVGRARDAGKGYSYILLVHDNGLSTVYGHVSGISVRDGDIIVQGQVIGYSGGTPGTSGAGNLTTGPHLHFEVRQNGVPVNPLGYLP